MRIATYYDNASTGRNDGNPLYITASLKRLQIYGDVARGHAVDPREVARWLYAPDALSERMAKEWFEKSQHFEVDHLAPYEDLKHSLKHDLHLWVDWGEDGLGGILPAPVMECPRPMAYWASDTHLGYDYRLAMARKADWVFCAQKRAVEEMARDGVKNPIWLPHAVEPLAYPKFEMATKKYDVCFVGHVNSENRLNALDRLYREFPNFFWGQRRFEEAAQKYGDSKIVFNMSMLDDVVMRVFEVMATGSFLLTNWIPTIEELFTDGKHLVLYRSEEEMIEKARYYLDHENERQKIAEAGYQEVMAKHTINHRLQTILKTVVPQEALYAVDSIS